MVAIYFSDREELLTVAVAAVTLGISMPRVKQLIYDRNRRIKANKLNLFEHLKLAFEMFPKIDIRDREALNKLLTWTDHLSRQCYSSKK